MVLDDFIPVIPTGMLACLIPLSLCACGSSGGGSTPDLAGEALSDSITGSETQQPLSEATPEVAEVPPEIPKPPPVISLSWIAPVEREDGTPLAMAEIAGYRVYYGTSKGDYTSEVELKGSSTMEITLENLVSGIYYFVVTTVDEDGRESVNSEEIVRSI